jgi:hypothetical protein
VLVLSENTLAMRPGRRSKLPRGLRWDPTSSNICFSWRDARGRLHQQSTGTADPAEAMAVKLRFLRDREAELEKRRLQSEDRGRPSLAEAAELYFELKAGRPFRRNDRAGAAYVSQCCQNTGRDDAGSQDQP